jgi:predicted TIM-barrel fold metal-dependent hydrolase
LTGTLDRRRDQLAGWDRWLALHQEHPLDREQAIVDPHHHLWDRGGHTYLAKEFRTDIADSGVVASVYVECLSAYRQDGPPELRPVGETEFVARQVPANSPFGIARGIVGYADLSLGGGAAEVLDAHEEAAGTRFKGVRYATAWDADAAIHGSYSTHRGMLHEASVVSAARVLEQRGLTLDTWLYFHQLDDVRSLARACPALSIVIDHCGGLVGIGRYAAQRAQVFDAWRANLQGFGSLSNVVLKFGGLAMPLAGFAWKSREVPPSSEDLAAAWRPYFDVCLEVFGPQRCMFESNFPVDRSGCSYTVVWNAFTRLARRLPVEERAALFERTARRIYRL